MKTLVTKTAMAIFSVSAVTFSAFSQDKKDEIHVRIERTIDGKKQLIEKRIDATNLSDDERQRIIEEAQDTVIVNGKEGKKHVKVIIEDLRSDENNHRSGHDNEEDFTFEWNEDNQHENDGNPRIKMYKRRFEDGKETEWEEDFTLRMDRLNNRLRYLGDDVSRRFRGPVYRWDNELLNTEKPPIRGLDVFPNRPDAHVLNVRFFAPKNEKVSIKVIDITGKTVAEENIDAFEGEYVGQIKLKKDTKGTFFVIVAQGNDGVSQRVVL